MRETHSAAGNALRSTEVAGSCRIRIQINRNCAKTHSDQQAHGEDLLRETHSVAGNAYRSTEVAGSLGNAFRPTEIAGSAFRSTEVAEVSIHQQKFRKRIQINNKQCGHTYKAWAYFVSRACTPLHATLELLEVSIVGMGLSS